MRQNPGPSGFVLIITKASFCSRGGSPNAAVPVREYLRLGFVGLLTLFGSTTAAVAFLLDLFRIPADTFQLFLATSVVNARFGSLLAALHTICVALLGSAAILGVLRFRFARVARYLVVTVLLSAASVGGLRVLFNIVLKPAFAGEELVYRCVRSSRLQKPGKLKFQRVMAQVTNRRISDC